jgi:hypothetical protein
LKRARFSGRVSCDCQKTCDKAGGQSSGGARGGKARLEYKKPPPEKPDISGFSGNSILPEAKCSAAEAQSKKSGMDFFDKLKHQPGPFGT